MAKDVITRFKLETTQYDSKIKSAAKELTDFTKTATQAKDGFNQFTKANVDAAKALGTMATSTTNAKQRAQELVGAYNDLVRTYNHLNQEQQQSDFGKAMAESMRQLQQRIKDVKQEMQGLETGTGGFLSGDKLSGMLQVFGGNLMTKGASMLVGFASEMGDMVKQGIELAKQGEGIRIAFERLGRGDILDGLRQATHGTVTDLELMKAAVKFNDFKLPLEELGTMLAFAQQKAKDTGQSVDYMVDSIVTGLGRKSLMILDNLGLSAAEIKEHMKETGDMTKAVGAIIRDQMAAAGDYVETAADRAAQATVSLQNKMEELGRKFQPLQEASNTFWTSVKVSILDIVGGPLAQFLNGLTEAGRQMQMLNNLQGSDTGKPTRVESQLSALRGSNFKNDKYRSQLHQYDQDIKVAEYFKKKYQEAGWAGGSVLSDITRRFKVNVTGEEDIDNLITSLKTMRSEYQKGAKEIMKPVKPVVDTTQAEQNVATLKKKLKELEEDRKKAVKAGDQDKVDLLTKQINETKTNIGYLDPNAVKTGKVKTDDFTEIIGLIGNAQEKVSDLQRQIRESWDQNEITTLNQKLKDAQNELDVLMGKLPKDTVVDITVDANTADALQKIGNIEGVTIDPKTLTVTADTTEALQRVQKLVADTNGTIIEMKVVPVVTDEDIERSLREQYGKPIEVPVVPKTAGEALEQEVRVKLAEQNIETDMQTLRTLLETQVKNGIEGIDIPSDLLIQQIIGEGIDIPDEYWQKLQDSINEKLKEMNFDPIDIDFKTGNNKGKKDKKEPMGDTKKVVSGLNQVASGLQMMGIELPEGINQVLGVMNGLMTIIQGISTIIGVTQTAAVTANTVAITALTAAVWANTASSFIPFANGGVIPGFAGGGTVDAGHAPDFLSFSKGTPTKFAGGGTVDAGHAPDFLSFSKGTPTKFAGGGVIPKFAGGGTVDAGHAPDFLSFSKGVTRRFASGGTIPHANDGYFVGGTHFSSDVTPIMANAGELVLNKAQQGVLANQLQGGGIQNLNLVATIKGEQIRLALNNNGRRTGRGEYVQSNRR